MPGFRAIDLKNFETFRKVLLEFISFYKLEFEDSDEKLVYLDRYLWQVGKEKFPKQYKKKKKSETTEK